VKITVNLLAKVLTKLEEVCDMTGESRTDAINRSIQLYALYHEAVEKGEQFRIVGRDGREREFFVL
jgi:metal-responsive CopG/Arc/MetJ family transcriptional regulator